MLNLTLERLGKLQNIYIHICDCYRATRKGHMYKATTVGKSLSGAEETVTQTRHNRMGSTRRVGYGDYTDLISPSKICIHMVAFACSSHLLSGKCDVLIQ
jgi:hypothetical protein